MRGEKDLYILLDPVGPAPYIDLFRSPTVLLRDLQWFLRIARLVFLLLSNIRSPICFSSKRFARGLHGRFDAWFAMASAHRASRFLLASIHHSFADLLFHVNVRVVCHARCYLRNMFCRLRGVPPKDIDRGALRAPGLLRLRFLNLRNIFCRL